MCSTVANRKPGLRRKQPYNLFSNDSVSIPSTPAIKHFHVQYVNLVKGTKKSFHVPRSSFFYNLVVMSSLLLQIPYSNSDI